MAESALNVAADGDRAVPDGHFGSFDPATGQLLGSFAEATEQDVERAVSTARRAARAWEATAPTERTVVLLRLAGLLEEQEHELVAQVVAEVGKPLGEAREEVSRSVQLVLYHAGVTLDPIGETLPSPSGSGLVYTTRRPLGVVGLVTPWNFPAAIPLWKLAPALAYGNAVVWKPAPQATMLATHVARLVAEAGLPDGVLSLVSGGRSTGAALARAALDGLSFTGSTTSGQSVARAALDTGARFQGELGGKNASVVLADADLHHAARTIARAAFGFAGQKCTATSRVVVEDAVYDELRRQLVDAVEGLVVGDPRDEATDIGPMIDSAAVERVATAVADAERDGAIVLTGGHRRDDLGPGFFEPTVLDDVSPGSSLAQEEIFGPVLAVIRARSADEALQIANGTRYGLTAAVFTRDVEQALRFGQMLEAGMVRVNGPTPGVAFNAPFGPHKASGIGLPEQGKAARDFFTRERTVTIVSR